MVGQAPSGWCGLLQLAHKGQGPPHVQNPQWAPGCLSRKDSIRLEEDEPRRLVRSRDRAPGALVEACPGLPLYGPSFSST